MHWSSTLTWETWKQQQADKISQFADTLADK
jgi:hypothetical protein